MWGMFLVHLRIAHPRIQGGWCRERWMVFRKERGGAFARSSGPSVRPARVAESGGRKRGGCPRRVHWKDAQNFRLGGDDLSCVVCCSWDLSGAGGRQNAVMQQKVVGSWEQWMVFGKEPLGAGLVSHGAGRHWRRRAERGERRVESGERRAEGANAVMQQKVVGSWEQWMEQWMVFGKEPLWRGAVSHGAGRHWRSEARVHLLRASVPRQPRGEPSRRGEAGETTSRRSRDRAPRAQRRPHPDCTRDQGGAP